MLRCSQSVDLIASCGLLFTAQPKAPAFVLAGASGWAVNDSINSLLVRKIRRQRILEAAIRSSSRRETNVPDSEGNDT